MLPIPDSFRSVTGLGGPKQYYPVRRSSKWGNLIWALIFWLIAAAIFLYAAYDGYTSYQAFGPAILAKTVIPWLIGSGLFFLVGVFFIWGAFSNWKKAVVIYDNGFGYMDRKGLQTTRWEDINSITSAVTRHYTNGIYTGTTHTYTILKRDQTRLVINDAIQKVEEVATKIRTSVYPLIYPAYAQSYNNGKPLSFGPVVLSKADGIQIGKKSYPWDQVAKVTIHQGFVQVAKKGGGWFSGASAAAATIPNLEVMLSILDQVVGVATK